MYSSFLLLLISFAAITCEEVERFTFDQDKNVLKKCVENYLSEISYLKTGEEVEDIAEVISEKFHKKIFNKKQFWQAITYYYNAMKNEASFLFIDRELPEKLKTALREALKNCVERKKLPTFSNEPQVLANFLDLILVDWPTSIVEMLHTQDGRSTLRLYAYTAGVRLVSALKNYSMSVEKFRQELLRIWLHRSEQLYDDRGSEIPYIRHRFTTNIDRMYSSVPLKDIHTINDVDSFISRRLENFTDRNPIIGRWSLHVPESSGFGVTSAENYLENHLNQCYQIILFFLELQLSDIITDEDDIYNGPIPYHVVPFFTQEIVWNSHAYKKYLMAWHENRDDFSKEECFLNDTTEDLIMRFSLLVAEKTAKSTTIASTTTTTSTKHLNHEYGPKKGGVRAADCGKHFLPNKRFKSMFHEQDKQSLKQPNTSFNRYGYIINNRNHYRFKLIEKDEKIYSKVFAGLDLTSGRFTAAVNFSSHD